MIVLQVNKFHWLKGGSESAYFSLSELLQKHGHQVVQFSMMDKRNVVSDYAHFFVDNIDYEKGGIANRISSAVKIIYSFEARKKMRALLAKLKPDVAHFHIFQHQISPSVFAPLRENGIPIILTLHDLKPICPNYKMYTHDGICERCKGKRFYNCLVYRCTKGSALKSLVNSVEMYFHYARGYYQSVDKYISPSSFYSDKMIEFGFPSTQIVHIPNFLDVSRFSMSNVDKGYGLYFGRLSEEKGCMTLLKALALCPDIPFYFVGGGPLEQTIRESIAASGLTNVTVLGFKSGAELWELISKSSFTVIPSEWYENCPMSVLESFAIGKPVIGARIGGLPELIAEGVDGLTFESGNHEDLAGKIDYLWNEPAIRKSMGKEGRWKVAHKFSSEKHYEQIMEVYRNVTNI